MKKIILSQEDQELFLQAMQHVCPLKIKHPKHFHPQKKNVPLQHKSKFPSSNQVITLSDEAFTPCTAEEMLFFARPGLQNKTLRQLRQGKLKSEKILDLHANRLLQAKQRLEKFLDYCQKTGIRSVLIIHGKGTATLKSAIATWLKNYVNTLAFSSAIPYHGGAGAIYLLLRVGRQNE